MHAGQAQRRCSRRTACVPIWGAWHCLQPATAARTSRTPVCRLLHPGPGHNRAAHAAQQRRGQLPLCLVRHTKPPTAAPPAQRCAPASCRYWRLIRQASTDREFAGVKPAGLTGRQGSAGMQCRRSGGGTMPHAGTRTWAQRRRRLPSIPRLLCRDQACGRARHPKRRHKLAPAKMDDAQLLSWATNLPSKLLHPEHSPKLASALARWAFAGLGGTLGPPSRPSTFSVHRTWFKARGRLPTARPEGGLFPAAVSLLPTRAVWAATPHLNVLLLHHPSSCSQPAVQQPTHSSSGGSQAACGGMAAAAAAGHGSSGSTLCTARTLCGAGAASGIRLRRCAAHHPHSRSTAGTGQRRRSSPAGATFAAAHTSSIQQHPSWSHPTSGQRAGH